MLLGITVKPVLSVHSKRRPKIGFQDRLSLNAGQKYCRMLQESILQYFRPSLSYHLSLRSLFCLFLSGCLRQVLLYRIFLLSYFMSFSLLMLGDYHNNPFFINHNYCFCVVVVDAQGQGHTKLCAIHILYSPLYWCTHCKLDYREFCC